jgi:hypothetical protein
MKGVQNYYMKGIAMVAESRSEYGDNPNNVRHEASRTFRNWKREYLKEKINELETNSRNRNIRNLYRGINEFKKGYQLRTNLVKEENGDLLADSHNIVNR